MMRISSFNVKNSKIFLSFCFDIPQRILFEFKENLRWKVHKKVSKRNTHSRVQFLGTKKEGKNKPLCFLF